MYCVFWQDSGLYAQLGSRDIGGMRKRCGYKYVMCDETTKNTENINNEKLSIL